MFGEVLETAEGWSLNRGSDKDVRASREVVEWLDTRQGRDAKKEVADLLQEMWERDKRANRR